MPIVTAFRTVRNIFLREENHTPRFMYSQKIPGSPNVNQLAKSAV